MVHYLYNMDLYDANMEYIKNQNYDEKFQNCITDSP